MSSTPKTKHPTLRLLEPLGYVRTVNGVPEADDDGVIFSYGPNAFRDVYGKEEWGPVCPVASYKPREPEQAAFERWAESESPSGDVTEVQNKWNDSIAYSVWQDDGIPVIPIEQPEIPVGQCHLKKRDIGVYTLDVVQSTYFRGLGWNEAIDAMNAPPPVVDDSDPLVEWVEP